MAEEKRKRVKCRANRNTVRARHVCEHCGSLIGPFEVHHIRRKSQGGGDEIENLACLCGFSPERVGNEQGCHRAHHDGRITFHRSSTFLPPESVTGAVVFDEIWDEYREGNHKDGNAGDS